MRTFSLFIRDDRYSVPTLAFLTAVDEEAVVKEARARLEESSHHCAIEVMEDSRLVSRIDRPGGRTDYGGKRWIGHRADK